MICFTNFGWCVEVSHSLLFHDHREMIIQNARGCLWLGSYVFFVIWHWEYSSSDEKDLISDSRDLSLWEKKSISFKQCMPCFLLLLLLCVCVYVVSNDCWPFVLPSLRGKGESFSLVTSELSMLHVMGFWNPFLGFSSIQHHSTQSSSTQHHSVHCPRG